LLTGCNADSRGMFVEFINCDNSIGGNCSSMLTGVFLRNRKKDTIFGTGVGF